MNTGAYPGGIHFDYRVQQEYIITEDMLRYWKNQCVAEPAHTNTDECKACQYRGKGTREGYCDFDDTDMEKIFRSRPHTSTPNPCEEQGCTDTEQCDEICEHSCIYSPAWVKGHDTAIRNATLDDIVIAANFEQNRPITPFMISGWCNKLRTQEQP